MTFRAEARDALADDLRFGKKVGGLTLRHLIESDLAGPQCGSASLEVSGIIFADEPDRSLLCTRYTERLIKEWLDKREDEITDLAAEMRQDYEESQRAA